MTCSRNTDWKKISATALAILPHFAEAFVEADVDAALAASVFHSGAIAIPELKQFLHGQGIEVRL